MGNTVMVQELTFDILNSVAKPMSSLHEFKNDILTVLSKNFPSCDCQFASYTEGNDPLDKFVMCDILSKGLPEVYGSNDWVENYFSTYIFNPNRCSTISDSDRSVFRLSDLMTPLEYEQCRNYKEIMCPNGYYYPMAAVLKHRSNYIGQVSLLRRKRDGEFSENEAARLELICPYIISRLQDYDECRGKRLLQDLFLTSLNQNVSGLLVLDENFRFIVGNDLGEDYCSDIFPDPTGSNSFFLRMATVVQKQYQMGALNFQQKETGKNRMYYISIEPHVVSNGENDFYCFLVYLNTGNYSETSDALQNNSYYASLSPRQREIVTLVAAGLSNREIAQRLIISEHTVRKHIENIRVQLGAKNRISVLKKLSLL